MLNNFSVSTDGVLSDGFSENHLDSHFMTLALYEAKKAEFTARPNPAVGCVLVKDGQVIAQGHTQKVGGSHAEVMALRHAKERGHDVAGATAYVTLEPCSHYGRTPPCANALIQSGVSCVVIATLDPNPQVSGRGVAMLKDAGIAVVVGVREDEAKAINAGFLKAMATRLPYVRLKLGVSLDGRVAMASGQSKWITSEPSRADVQRLRAKSGVIITGSGTILADNPSLNVRLSSLDIENIPKPKIVVLDRSGRLNNTDDYQVFKDNNTLLWQGDLADLLKVLVAEHQCYDVLVEAGATLASGFLSENLVDEFIIYQAPCLLGATARPMFVREFDDLADKLEFELKSVKPIGTDVKMVFRPKRRPSNE